jgi:hypothetical protein
MKSDKSDTTSTSSNRGDFSFFVNLITGVGATGGGQKHSGRVELHLSGARRSLRDPQMWTHAFLASGAYLAFYKGLYDMFFLLLFTTPLSLLYHSTYEKPGKLAKLEGIFAKLLYIYGTVQLFHAVYFTSRIMQDILYLLIVYLILSSQSRLPLFSQRNLFCFR